MLLPLMPHLFLASSLVLAASIDWPKQWLVSGSPILTYVWLLGTANGHRVLPFVPLWTLVATLNLTYAISATSWLLYWVFLAGCYPIIIISCLAQFDVIADIVRERLRSFLRHLHFVDDKIGWFQLPALDIDSDVKGLVILRGVTISLSTLTVVVHGVEASIRMHNNTELVLRTDAVTIALLRKIDTGNVYVNLKSDQSEMTSREKAEDTLNSNGAGKLFKLSNQQAMDKYEDSLRQIKEASPIQTCYKEVIEGRGKVGGKQHGTKQSDAASKLGESNDTIAAVCSMLSDQPTFHQMPPRSITLPKSRSSSLLEKLLHRLPLLYRLLLCPLSYLHPIKIESITTSAPGTWMLHILNQYTFYETDETSADAKALQENISAWLSGARFVLSLSGVSTWAQFPLLTSYSINSRLAIEDAVLYRNPDNEPELKQIIRTGGATLSVETPLFLFPHHEHLLPPPPTKEMEEEQQAIVDASEGKPKAIQAQNELDRIRNDQANLLVALHLHLPFVVDQELLDMTAALLKASKLLETEKENASVRGSHVHGVKDFSRAVGSSIRDHVRKTADSAVVNDEWITKLADKITTQLETARGDIGYSGNFPVPLKPYREEAESASKLLV